MRDSITIENIEAMRRQEGIEDDELVQGIGRLEVGDIVNLTLLSSTVPPAAETLRVRITWVQALTFRGVLLRRPTTKSLSGVEVGARLTFAAAHIHSIPKGGRTDER